MLNNRIIRISAQPEDTIAEVFKNFRKDPDEAELIPAKITYHVCRFYRLKNPVSLVNDRPRSDNEFLNEVKKACAEESNRELVNPTLTEVRQLAEEFSPRHIHLVIELPDGEYSLLCSVLRC